MHDRPGPDRNHRNAGDRRTDDDFSPRKAMSMINAPTRFVVGVVGSNWRATASTTTNGDPLFLILIVFHHHHAFFDDFGGGLRLRCSTLRTVISFFAYLLAWYELPAVMDWLLSRAGLLGRSIIKGVRRQVKLSFSKIVSRQEPKAMGPQVNRGDR
jgi:hypothetical protein